jgi:hypothetical protein
MEYFKGVSENVESKMDEKCMVCGEPFKKGDKVTQVLMGVFGNLHAEQVDPSEEPEFGIGVAVILEAHSDCASVGIKKPVSPTVN